MRLEPTWRRVIFGSVWLAATLGVLRAEPLVESVVGAQHSICGAWGCGPPPAALIVWSAFAAIALFPAVWLVVQKWPVAARHWRGMIFLSVVAVVVVVLGVNTALWWNTAGDFARSYLLQRIMFATVSLVDLPAIPLIGAAGFFFWLARKGKEYPRSAHSRISTFEPTPSRLKTSSMSPSAR